MYKFLSILSIFFLLSLLPAISNAEQNWEEIYFGEFFEDLEMIGTDVKNQSSTAFNQINNYFIAACIKVNNEKTGKYSFVLFMPTTVNNMDVWVRPKTLMKVNKGGQKRFIKKGDLLISNTLSGDGKVFTISGEYNGSVSDFVTGVFHTNAIPTGPSTLKVFVDGVCIKTIHFQINPY